MKYEIQINGKLIRCFENLSIALNFARTVFKPSDDWKVVVK